MKFEAGDKVKYLGATYEVLAVSTVGEIDFYQLIGNDFDEKFPLNVPCADVTQSAE